MLYTEYIELVAREDNGSRSKCPQKDCGPPPLEILDSDSTFTTADLSSSTMVLNEILSSLTTLFYIFALLKLFCLKNASKKHFKEVSTIIFVLAVTVVFRNISVLSSFLYLSNCLCPWKVYMVNQFLLLAEYSSHYFAILLIFLMSINRFMFFVKRVYYKFFNTGYRLVLWFLLLLFISISSTITGVLTSKVEMAYHLEVGFVAAGQSGGFHIIINRIYIIFPVLSIICYLFIFHRIKKNSALISTATSRNQNTGTEKVFEQTLVIAVFYLFSYIFTEIGIFNEIFYSANPHQTIYLNLLTFINNLPQFLFPILLIFKNTTPHWAPNECRFIWFTHTTNIVATSHLVVNFNN